MGVQWLQACLATGRGALIFFYAQEQRCGLPARMLRSIELWALVPKLSRCGAPRLRDAPAAGTERHCMVCSLAGAIGLCERKPVGALMHLAVEQIVYSGEHQSVDHKGSSDDCEFRQYVAIHKVSWDGFLNSLIGWGQCT